MELSVVTTMYKSENYLLKFYQRTTDTIRKITQDYEIIFVNDGSPDSSSDLIVDLQQTDDKITLINLSRNFGHHKAMMTGLSYASGENVVLIDCDLEEDPEWIEDFYDKLQQLNVDVVYGVQKKRQGNFIKKILGSLYYRLVNSLASIDLPKNLVTFRIMRKRYVKSLLLHKEREVVISGLWYITGYKQFPIEITKKAKKNTTYTFKKKISVLVNSITAFSIKPLIYIFYSGLIILMFSLTWIIYLIIMKLIGNPVSGWVSLIVSIWLLGGLIIFFIGTIGIYIAKMFIEVKQRPYSIVKDVYKSGVVQDE